MGTDNKFGAIRRELKVFDPHLGDLLAEGQCVSLRVVDSEGTISHSDSNEISLGANIDRSSLSSVGMFLSFRVIGELSTTLAFSKVDGFELDLLTGIPVSESSIIRDGEECVVHGVRTTSPHLVVVLHQRGVMSVDLAAGFANLFRRGVEGYLPNFMAEGSNDKLVLSSIEVDRAHCGVDRTPGGTVDGEEHGVVRGVEHTDLLVSATSKQEAL